MKRDFGMPFLIENETLANCVELCNKLKLNFIELNMNFPELQVDKLNADELKSFCEKFNIYFTIHLDETFNPFDFNPYIREAYMKTLCDTIEIAKKISAPIINIHLAKGIYITLPNKKVYLFGQYNEQYLQHITTLRETCDSLLAGTNIKIAVENTEGFQSHEQKAIEVLLESKHFGLNLDIGHSYCANDMDMPFYQNHMDKLIHMHAHDSTRSHHHLCFGDGELDLSAMLKLADQCGARVVLEVKTIEALTKTVELLPKYFSK